MIQKPLAYKNPNRNIDPERLQAERLNGKLWFAYGIQDGANTFREADGKKAFREIRFMEVYCIVAEKGPFVHIYKDPNVNYRGQLSNEALDLGWARRTDLLLWENCLQDGFEQPLKAFLKSSSRLKKGFLPFYPSSKTNEKLQVKADLSLPFFVFYLDRDHKMALLGQKALFSPGTEKRILGWVPFKQLFLVNHNRIMTPNTSQEAAQSRIAHQSLVRIFPRPGQAVKYQAQGRVKRGKACWEKDPFEEVWPASSPRFILLDSLPAQDHIRSVAWFDGYGWQQGYTAEFIADFTFPHYEWAVYLDRIQLYDLMKRVDFMVESANLSPIAQQRILLQEAFLTLLSQKFPDHDPQMFLDWTIAEVTNALFGLPSQQEIAWYHLQDFPESAWISDVLIDQFFLSMVDKSRQLNHIFNSETGHSIQAGDEKQFYLIPQKLLP